MSDVWYFALGGQKNGPVGIDEMRARIRSGELAASDLAWTEGMGEWQPISSLVQLREVVPSATEESAPHEVAPVPVITLAYGGYVPNPRAPLGDYRRGVEFGGFWIRVVAFILDGLVLLVPNMIIQSMIGHFTITVPPVAGLNFTMMFSSMGGAFIPMLVDWVYFALMDSSQHQATLGKMACGLIVTDAQGRRLTFGRATGRHFAKLLSFYVCYIGVIMVGGDERKQGMHDKIAKTFVVYKKSLMPRSV